MAIHPHRRDRTMKALPSLASSCLRNALVAIAALGAAAAAPAQHNRWFVGANLDSASLTVARGDPDPFGNGYWEFGPSTTGYTVRGGLRVNRYFALEGAWQRRSDLSWSEPFATVAGVPPGLYDSSV